MTAVESRLGLASDGRFEGMFLTQLVAGSIIDEYRGDDFFVSACIAR